MRPRPSPRPSPSANGKLDDDDESVVDVGAVSTTSGAITTVTFAALVNAGLTSAAWICVIIAAADAGNAK